MFIKPHNLISQYPNVMFHSPELVFIEEGVTIGENSVIWGNVYITKNTLIGSNVEVFPFSTIDNSIIESGSTIISSNLKDAFVSENTEIGPWARLRPNASIGKNCKIGNFVEIKNSSIGDGTKISHLAYVGEAEIGENCNIGCGAIFVNFDGKTKHKTIVGNNCFIGSNCNIVAPVVISDNCFICAGTTITKNLDKNDFAIGRVREEIKKERALQYLRQLKNPT